MIALRTAADNGVAPSTMALVQTPVVLEIDRRMSRFVPIEELFEGRHFDQEIVVLCAR